MSEPLGYIVVRTATSKETATSPNVKLAYWHSSVISKWSLTATLPIVTRGRRSLSVSHYRKRLFATYRMSLLFGRPQSVFVLERGLHCVCVCVCVCVRYTSMDALAIGFELQMLYIRRRLCRKMRIARGAPELQLPVVWSKAPSTTCRRPIVQEIAKP